MVMRSIKVALYFVMLCFFACKKSTVDTYTKFKSYRIGYELTSAIPPVQLAEGTYVTATLDEHGALLIIKLDAHGNKVWEKNISQSSSHPTSFTATSDGGFIVSGYDNVSRSSLFATKYTASGDSVWHMDYNFPPGNANSLTTCLAPDGNLLISAGASSNDMGNPATFILKVNSSDGTLQYTKAIRGIADSIKAQPLSMVANNDAVYITGTYYVAQQTGPLLNGSAFVLRTNENGDSAWSVTKPPVLNDVVSGIYTVGESIAISADGNTVLMSSASAPFGYRVFDILPNSFNQVSGEAIVLEGYNAFTGIRSDTATFTFEDQSSLPLIKNTPDGGYIVTATDNFFLANENSTTHIALVKMGAQLNSEWQRTINLPDAATMPLGIFPVNDGYVIIAYVISDPKNDGSYSDIVFLKTDMNGNLVDGL
jgi:hypothetical protein